jgi:hypothetical protein
MRIGRAVVQSALALALFGQIGISKSSAFHELSIITCAEACSERIPLRSTDRLPGASGSARLERKGGTTEIEVELDAMKPASLFGGDYNTYVLWVVPPRGGPQNLGEVLLNGSNARTQAATSAVQLAILITAEPHYLVAAPSAFVVFENRPVPNGQTVKQPVLEGIYHFTRSTLEDAKEARGPVHSDVRQAFTSIRLAQRAGAAHLAREELLRAQRALEETLKFWKERRVREEIAAQAHETVRLAVAAQQLAEDRASHGDRDQIEGSGGGTSDTGRRDPTRMFHLSGG